VSDIPASVDSSLSFPTQLGLLCQPSKLGGQRRNDMRVLKYLGSFVIASAMLSGVSSTPAQVSVNIGVAPVCPYGYFPYAPYDCSPYGYYGPDWFTGGLFIGAGPWFHGPRGFYGHVDQRYDPHHGYHGPMPERGEQAFGGFRANAAHDEHGNPGTPRHDGGGEHNPGFAGGGHAGGGGHPSGGGGHR
jgi:hypothetical protein